jgi:outer membrane lipoprotein-sorting protein
MGDVSTHRVHFSARSLRWAAPVVAGVAVAAAAIIPSAAASADHPVLPARTAGQLLADLASVGPPTLSGTIVETARLGLPDLSSLPGADGELSWATLVTGSHTIRVWSSGASRQRVALLGQLAETDVIHDGKTLWTYSSQQNAVTHTTLPADVRSPDLTPASALPVTPAQAAAQALAAIDPTTRVSVDRTAEVAGRSAYQIVLDPKDSRSLVASVTIALDSQTTLPLRVQVYARGQQLPAFETAFTEISFAKPDPSVFAFVPPVGATVTQGFFSSPGAVTGKIRVRTSFLGGESSSQAAPGTVPGNTPGNSGSVVHVSAGRGVTKLGDGWTTVVETNLQVAPQLGPFTQFTTAVSGGHLLTTALVSVFFTNDGRVFIGSVNGPAIEQVATTGRGL